MLPIDPIHLLANIYAYLMLSACILHFIFRLRSKEDSILPGAGSSSLTVEVSCRPDLPESRAGTWPAEGAIVRMCPARAES